MIMLVLWPSNPWIQVSRLMKTILFGACTALAALLAWPAAAQNSRPSWKFDFGAGAAALGYTRVLPTSAYDAAAGFGFEPGAQLSALAAEGTDPNRGDALKGDLLTSEGPFLFSAAVPEGNYRVTVTLGHPKNPTRTTVKAEQRRLVLEAVATSPGQVQTYAFTVNVHTPKIAGNSRSVGLKPGELGPPLSANWDDRLTLEFNGVSPSVVSLEIAPELEARQVFLAGDSTVTDGRREPWSAWGQMLPRFFAPGTAVANYAESGLTLSSFRAQRRLDKILSQLRTGDYVLIQFGHNDQKEKGEDKGPFTSYKANLKDYVSKIREKGGLPVILSPMERRRWSGGTPQSTLTSFAEAARQVGTEEKVPVIDLNGLSLKVYAALGESGSKKAFVFVEPNTFPGQKDAIADNTHFSNYGAYLLARAIVQDIRANHPELSRYLQEDIKPFDLAAPDPFETFAVPLSPSPVVPLDKPDGS